MAKRIVTEWPGTKLLEGTAELHIFAVTPLSIKVIMNAVDNLYDWLGPKYPEDLCFIAHDGGHSLITISHEQKAWLCLDENLYNVALKLMPQIFEK